MSQSSTMTRSPFIAARRASAWVTVVLPSCGRAAVTATMRGRSGHKRQSGAQRAKLLGQRRVRLARGIVLDGDPLQRAAGHARDQRQDRAARAPYARRRRCGRCRRRARAHRPAAGRTASPSAHGRRHQRAGAREAWPSRYQRQRDLVRIGRLHRRLLRGLLHALQHRLQQPARRFRVALHGIQRNLCLRIPRDLRLCLDQVALQCIHALASRPAYRPRWRPRRGRLSAATVRSTSASCARSDCTSGCPAPSRPSIDCNCADSWSWRARSCTTEGAIAACAAAPARPLAASSRPSAPARSLRARARSAVSRLICSLSSRACMPSTRPCLRAVHGRSHPPVAAPDLRNSPCALLQPFPGAHAPRRISRPAAT